MEEISLAAKAYFNNSPSNIQQLARNFFRSIDTNHDGGVSFSEFRQFLQQNGHNWANPNWYFNKLDTDGNACLDFWEVLTFYYIVKTRSVWCDGCKANLHSLYFTCVECFDSAIIHMISAPPAILQESFAITIAFFSIASFCSGTKEGFPMVQMPTWVCCDVCHANLHGLYFTCVECFDSGNNAYDLCSSCYAERKFCHHHSSFLDSFVLLRNKRGLSHGTNANMGTKSHIQPPPDPLRANAPALAPPRPSAMGQGNKPLMHYALLAVHMANVANSAGTLMSQGADANGGDPGFSDATGAADPKTVAGVLVDMVDLLGDAASNCPMM